MYNNYRKMKGPRGRKGRNPMKANFEQISIFPENATRSENHISRPAALRARLMENGGDMSGFSDADILTHQIGLIRGTDEAATIAEDLLDAFGSLKAVLEARPEQLRQVSGVGSRIAALISSGREIAKAYQRALMDTPQRISNSTQAEAYCKSLLTGFRNERFYVIALNAQCQILGKRKISEGSLSEVSAYPRMVMETALNYNAHSVLLSHNHPGGTCAPSPEDISSTLQLQRLLNGVGILVLDHIIVAGANTYSMIQHGDIDYRIKNRI